MDLITSSGVVILETVGAVVPVALFLFAFHVVVLRRPIPHLARMNAGFGFVVVGFLGLRGRRAPRLEQAVPGVVRLAGMLRSPN